MHADGSGVRVVGRAGRQAHLLVLLLELFFQLVDFGSACGDCRLHAPLVILVGIVLAARFGLHLLDGVFSEVARLCDFDFRARAYPSEPEALRAAPLRFLGALGLFLLALSACWYDEHVLGRVGGAVVSAVLCELRF